MSGTNKPPSDEAGWIDMMAEREDEHGSFSGVAGVRTKALGRIPTDFKDWGTLEKAIRPEVPKVFVRLLRDSIATDNFAGAMTAVWNAVTHDLRTKVLRFGVQHFSALEGMPEVETADELEENVTDYKLLLGCQRLGLLSEEAFAHLKHCQALISGYLKTAKFPGEIDRLDVLTFVKNCVKYSLAVDGPAPGIDMSALLTGIDKEQLVGRVVEFENALKHQPEKVVSTVARLLFKKWVDAPGASQVTQANIIALYPIAWKYLTDTDRRAIAQDYLSVRLSGTDDQASRGWYLIREVQALRYLPEDIATRYFEAASSSLYNAHNDFNNFANEVGPARDLRALGSWVPESARATYVRAVTQAFLGNPYGVSHGAEPHLEGMIQNFEAASVECFFKLLRTDADLRSTLRSEGPAERLAILLKRFEGRIAGPDLGTAATLASESVDNIRKMFSGKAAGAGV